MRRFIYPSQFTYLNVPVFVHEKEFKKIEINIESFMEINNFQTSSSYGHENC